MINVLYTINGMRINGMSAVIMQYIKNLSKEEYSFTIFTDEIDSQFFQDLKENKVRIIQSKMRRKNQFAYYRELLKIMREGHFDILHAHGNSSTIAVELVAAKQSGIPMRVAHSHNTTCDHIYIDKILRPIFYRSYTLGIGCGIEAGKWMFGNHPHIILKNGVDLQRYQFNQEIRDEIRHELCVEEKLVLGHVGRFTDQKNHKFLLRIFQEYHQINDKSVLLLVGNGPLEEQIKQEAQRLNIIDDVIFYGTTPNTEKVYSAMDCFVFPSKYEGVPLTLVEAQANGLACFISDKVSPEVIQTRLVTCLSLEDCKKWVEALPKSIKHRKFDSEKAISELETGGFSLSRVIEELDGLYKRTRI